MIASVEPQADHQLDESGAEQHIHQDVVQLQEEPHEWSLLASFRQLVAAVFFEAARDLGGLKARLGVAVEPPQHLIGGQGMPGRRAALGLHVYCCVHLRTPIRSVSRSCEDAVDPDDGEPRLLYPAVRKSANSADIRITITAVASASRSANKRRILSPLNEVIAFGMVLP